MTRNRGHVYRSTVRREDDGLSLLDALAARFDHSTRDEWRQRVALGLVLLDGRHAEPDVRLRAGQLVEWHRPPWEEPDAPTTFDLVHEDSELLAIAKPAGLPVLPGAGFLETTLLHVVRSRWSDARPVHRLGRWTSGLVLFARTPGARASLSAAFRESRVERRYRALASGEPSSDAFEIDVAVGPVPHDLLGDVHAACPGGRSARSRVSVVARRPAAGGESAAFLADVDIFTGRPHQVRIHLAAAGHPLVGDPLYAAGGRPAPGTRALPGDPGYLLHASRLGLEHPATGASLVVEWPPPASLAREAALRW